MHILETRSLGKSFKGFVAVNDVNLQVRHGTIHAMIGPNGAGKTTVFNLLTRFLSPSEGSILYKGEAITTARHRISPTSASYARFRSPPYFPT